MISKFAKNFNASSVANDNYLFKFNLGSGKLLQKATSIAIPAIGAVSLGSLISNVVNKIKNDATRKNLVSDLHLNDPILSEIPEDQLLEWYATIYHFAPKFSLDKAAVRDVLHTFARFGKVDVNTIKMIAETEKATAAAAKDDSNTAPWTSILSNVANAITLGT